MRCSLLALLDLKRIEIERFMHIFSNINIHLYELPDKQPWYGGYCRR